MYRRQRPLKLPFLLGVAILSLLAWVLWEAAPNEMGQLGTEDLLFLSTLLLIGAVSIIMLSVEAQRRSASLHVVHWTFVYLFLFLAPAVQFKMGRFPWGRLSADEFDLLMFTNMAILLWSAAWIVSRAIQFRAFRHLRFVSGPTVRSLGTTVTIGVSIIVAIFLALTLGMENLLFRGKFGSEFVQLFGEGPLSQIAYFCIRGVTVAAFAGGIVSLRRARRVSLKTSVLLVLAVCAMVLVNFPLGGARYWIGTVYLGSLLLLFGTRARNSWLVALALIFSVLLLYPRLGQVRNPNASWSWYPRLLAASFFDSVRTGDFDAYTMIAHTIDYVRNEGITYGRQLLGVALFWVPRELWVEKPIGSGWLVAIWAGLPWRNVSSPLIAEGFVNFGWVGIIVFSFIYSGLLGYMERWSQAVSTLRPVPLVVVLYPFLHGLVFFQLRGDLMSSTAFIVGLVVSFTPLVLGHGAKLRGRVNREARGEATVPRA